MRNIRSVLAGLFLIAGNGMTAHAAEEGALFVAETPNKQLIAQLVNDFEQGRFVRPLGNSHGVADEYLDKNGQVTAHRLIDVTTMDDHTTCLAYQDIGTGKIPQKNFVCINGWVSQQGTHMRDQTYSEDATSHSVFKAQSTTLAPLEEAATGYVVVSNLTGRPWIINGGKRDEAICRNLGVSFYLPGTDWSKAAVNHMPEAIEPDRAVSICVRRHPRLNSMMVNAG